MELLIRLIEFIVKAALEGDKQNKAPVSPAPPRSQSGARSMTPPHQMTAQVSSPRFQPGPQVSSPRAQAPAPAPLRTTQARSKPLMTGSTAASQDPTYDDGGWRSAVAFLALILLVIIVVAWLAVVAR
jgi:hypothetical protein